MTRSVYDKYNLKYPLDCFVDTIELDLPYSNRIDYILWGMQTICGDGYNPLFLKLQNEHINQIYFARLVGHAEATYNPFKNVIVIAEGSDVSDLRENILEEELVHAGQNRVYPDGIGQYAWKFGASNIEFEAKLTLDLISFVNGGSFDLGACPNNQLEYSLWIMKLCGEPDNPTFPSMSRVLATKEGLDGYYEMAKAFTKKAPQYNYPILTTLKPLYINFTYRNYGKD